MKSLIARTLSRWFGRPAHPAQSRPPQRYFRPTVEGLEDRQLMSITSLTTSVVLTSVNTATINGTDAADVFVVKHVTDTKKAEVFLNGVSKGQFDPATTSSIKINGLGGNDTFTVEYPFAYHIAITIDGGAGVNTLVDGRTFLVGAPGEWHLTGVNTGTLGYVGGTPGIRFVQMQNLTGGAFDDTFVVESAGQITGTIRGGAGSNTIFLAYDSGWVNAWEGGNVVNHVAVIRGIQNFGGNATSTIRAGNYTNTWDVTASDKFVGYQGRINSMTTTKSTLTGSTLLSTSLPPIQFSGFGALVGGDLNDTFKLGEYSDLRLAPLFVSINGAGGTNALDFSAVVATDLFVNLSTNTTIYMDYSGNPELYFNMYGFSNVTGGAANDIIVGNNLANRLDGGPGNDVLIGRDGADTLLGSSGNDALIGGFTDFDMDPAALRSYVRHEVRTQSGNVFTLSYVNQILDTPKFFDQYARGDRFTDTLLGGSGNDTFYLWAPPGGLWNDVFDGLDGDSWTYDIKAPL